MIIKIDIQAQFGSDFQTEAALTTLETMIQGWAIHYRLSHKKNKIEFTIIRPIKNEC